MLSVANMKRRPSIQLLLLVNRFLVVVVVVLAVVVGGVSSESAYQNDNIEEETTANDNGGQRLLRGGIVTTASAAEATAVLQDMENASAGQRVAIMKEYYGDAYVGCFLEGLSLATLETDDVAECLVHCLEKEYAFAAIQKLTECSCSNDYSIFGTPASSDEECETAAVGAEEVAESTANFVFATKHTSVTTPRRAIFASLMAWLQGASNVSGTDSPSTGLATEVPTFELTMDGSSYSDAPTPSPKPKESDKPGKPEKPCDKDKEKKGVLHKIGSLLFGPSKPKPKPKPEPEPETKTADVVDTIKNGVKDLLGVTTSAPTDAGTYDDGEATSVKASVLDTVKDKVGNILGLGTDAPSDNVGAPAVKASLIGVLGGETVAPTLVGTSAGTVEATFDASGADLSEAPTPSPVAKKPLGGHTVKPPPGVKLSGNPGARPKPHPLSEPPPNVKLTGNLGGQKILPKFGSTQSAFLAGDGLSGVSQLLAEIFAARGEAYQGCYKDVPMLQAMHFGSHSNHNIPSCRAYCLEEGYDYAGLREGHLCFCDNCYDKYGKADQDADCDANCTMSGGSANDICGGTGYLSVYASRDPTPSPTHAPTVTPSPTGDSDLTEAHKGYRGCYFDNSTVPVLGHKSGSDHSIESCISYCEGRDDDYAGLKAGKECYCANFPNSSNGAEPDDSLCNILCTEGGGGMCGGQVGLSVFSTDVEESRE